MCEKYSPTKEFVDLVLKMNELKQDESKLDEFIKCLSELNKTMPSISKMIRDPFGFIYDIEDKVYFSFVIAEDGKLTVKTEQIGIKVKD